MHPITKKEINSLIVKCIQDVNRVLDKEKRIKIDKNTDLYGGSSPLDSVALVNFLVELEQLLLEKYDLAISIMDAKAFSVKNSPFRSALTLTDFIYNKTREVKNVKK